MANVEGQITIDAFKRARTIQAARAAGLNTAFHRLFRQMLNHMTSTAAGNLRFIVPTCLPQSGDVPQPEVRRLHINRHLTDVMLNIRVVNLVLRGDVLQGVVVSGLGSAQKRSRIVRNEASLPSLL